MVTTGLPSQTRLLLRQQIFDYSIIASFPYYLDNVIKEMLKKNKLYYLLANFADASGRVADAARISPA